eukprot:3941266-Rhodomonas_salina.10
MHGAHAECAATRTRTSLRNAVLNYATPSLCGYAMSGTDASGFVSSTDVCYGGTRCESKREQRLVLAVIGMKVPSPISSYASAVPSPVLTLAMLLPVRGIHAHPRVLPSYALPTRCPVLTRVLQYAATARRAHHAMSGYAAPRFELPDRACIRAECLAAFPGQVTAHIKAKNTPLQYNLY